jgi:hypothetical protein
MDADSILSGQRTLRCILRDPAALIPFFNKVELEHARHKLAYNTEKLNGGDARRE